MYFITKTWNFIPKTSRFFKKKYFSTIQKIKDVEIDKIRNVGIFAHIDAGKTTTTERMLYFAGLINHMGEVHHGNTVTDYMDQERERGITITAAAVTFYWKAHQINLIDTPGHIDFTMEVEQTLSVLDGAVVVLDGSAGVEAQTQTVWRQADRYRIPRIVFINKTDRIDADIKMCCKSLENKLEIPYLLLQLPIKENGQLVGQFTPIKNSLVIGYLVQKSSGAKLVKNFVSIIEKIYGICVFGIGIIDVLSMEMLHFGTFKDKQVHRTLLTEEKYPKYWNDAAFARSELIDKLADYNDDLANVVISSESLDNIASVDLVNALRTVTYTQVAAPVLVGSAYKNIGVQSLMDAVVLYLPSPDRKNQQYKFFENNLCAKAFKVIHDKQKGPLVFFRLYNGTLTKSQKIYSIQQECSEQVGRIYIAHADDYVEVETVKEGNIAVVNGLKKVMSGDLVTNSQSASQKAKKNMLQLSKDSESQETNMEKLLGIGVTVPEPVFFCSIEPPSLASQSTLDQALNELQREDPSLRVSLNSETGQIVLAGMGELHLEIIRDRILKEYKVEADLGPLQISYRESPIKALTDSLTVAMKIGNSKQSMTVKMSLLPTDPSEQIKDIMKLDKTPEAASNIASIFPKHLLAVRQGIEVGLRHGPKISSQVVNTRVELHMLEVGRGTSETIIAATSTQLVQKLLKESGTDILEPIMFLEIVVPEEHLSAVLADLSSRRTIIKNIDVRGKSKLVLADVPLSELLGYSTILRTLTSGTATFAMEFNKYEKMSSVDEITAIRNVRGF